MQEPIILAGLIALAFVISIPCGYMRESFPRFSFMWFLLIHLPIPVVVVMRMAAGFSWHVFPLTLGAAVAGQIVGGMIRKRGGNVG